MIPPRRLVDIGERNDWSERLRQQVAAGSLVAGEGIRISERGNHTLIEAIGRARGGASEASSISPFIIRGFHDASAPWNLTCDRVTWDDFSVVEEESLNVITYCGPPNGVWIPRGTNADIATLASNSVTGDDLLVTVDGEVWPAAATPDALEAYPYFLKTTANVGEPNPKSLLVCAKHGDYWVDLNVLGRRYELMYRKMQACISGVYMNVVLRITQGQAIT